jgi:hypothetical protein
MIGTRIKGYQLNLKIGDNYIRGIETTGLKIKPNFEETILKEMNGSALEEFVDFDLQLSIAGKAYEKDGAEAWEDFETLRETAHAGTNISFVYGRFEEGGRIISGTGVITDNGEDSNSKDTATFSGTIDADKGSVEFDTYTAP